MTANKFARVAFHPPDKSRRLSCSRVTLGKLAPVFAISQELVKFDTQKMVNPEINGVEYQRGELWGYEVRQYLLEKFNHTCVYCGATNKPFNARALVPVFNPSGLYRAYGEYPQRIRRGL
ncbi:RRXRR domain-containing protein [Microseira wollei]|uniref:RRXRR domain-containing protein n=1 Tax=Microseira wollei TaxID=467598 RepID=UPI0035A2425E